MPCVVVSSTFDPMGEFISISAPPSGPGSFCQHAVQGSPRQRDLEIIAAKPAGTIENRICGGVEGGRVRGSVGQFFLRRRDTPGLMRQTAECKSCRTDTAARGINDRGN